MHTSTECRHSKSLLLIFLFYTFCQVFLLGGNVGISKRTVSFKKAACTSINILNISELNSSTLVLVLILFYRTDDSHISDTWI